MRSLRGASGRPSKRRITMQAVETIQTKAAEAYGWFERAMRGEEDDAETYYRLRDGRPEWVYDLVYAGHGEGEMFPDDWRYECIHSALEAISEADIPEDVSSEFADNQVDAYNGERLARLASNSLRVYYCDDAAQVLEAAADADMLYRIALGQYAEASEVCGQVLAFLTELVQD